MASHIDYVFISENVNSIFWEWQYIQQLSYVVQLDPP
jgi:hypothetical protein